MRVLFAASEAAPFIKVGGLGDVIGSLPKALLKHEIDARVILPLYSAIPQHLRDKMTFKCAFEFLFAWRQAYCGIFECESGNVKYYFIDNMQYFYRPNVYGEYDDAERFAFFSNAVLEALPRIDFIPDIINANDWHTALVPVYLNIRYKNDQAYQSIKSIFSIHNIEFQGRFGTEILGNVFGISNSHISLLRYDGCLNLMKGAIECADRVITVSKSYAQEILSGSCSFGLDRILSLRSYKLTGIINGIDTEVFNPETDSNLSINYNYKTRKLKKENKKSLQEILEFEINESIPLIGMVTRLTSQKGIELLRPVIHEFFARDLQLVVLGTGDSDLESFVRYCEYHYPAKARALIEYSAIMSSMIYAGADLFLMPSKAEPCGLSQIISMRYGTPPIVHAVGGLKDTVTPFNIETGEGNGINFQSYNAHDMLNAVDRAIELFHKKTSFNKLVANAMKSDFSWDKTISEYIHLFNSI